MLRGRPDGLDSPRRFAGPHWFIPLRAPLLRKTSTLLQVAKLWARYTQARTGTQVLPVSEILLIGARLARIGGLSKLASPGSATDLLGVVN